MTLPPCWSSVVFRYTTVEMNRVYLPHRAPLRSLLPWAGWHIWSLSKNREQEARSASPDLEDVKRREEGGGGGGVMGGRGGERCQKRSRRKKNKEEKKTCGIELNDGAGKEVTDRDKYWGGRVEERDKVRREEVGKGKGDGEDLIKSVITCDRTPTAPDVHPPLGRSRLRHTPITISTPHRGRCWGVKWILILQK